jgi:hypothetical protein
MIGRAAAPRTKPYTDRCPGEGLDPIYPPLVPPVLRVIHTLHQAVTLHRSYQSRYTGERRCTRQMWIPAFAGKARKGRRAEITE